MAVFRPTSVLYQDNELYLTILSWFSVRVDVPHEVHIEKKEIPQPSGDEPLSP